MRKEVLLSTILFVGASTVARADPSATDIAIAKNLFGDATADEEGERWADALAKLERVVAIKETPGIRFHIALCQERLGTLLVARTSYERAARLAEKTTGVEPKRIVADSAAAIVRIDGRLPTLTVNLTGAGSAQIRLDGQPFDKAKLGRPFRHDPGEVHVEATVAGKRPFERRIVVVDRDNAVVDIVLEEAFAPAVAPAVSPPAPVPTTGSGPRSLTAPASETARVPTSAWITGGATVASAGVAIYWFVRRTSLVADTEATCVDPYIRCDRQARDSKASTYLVGLIAAGTTALVLGGVTTYLVIRPGASAPVSGVPLGHVAVGGQF